MSKPAAGSAETEISTEIVRSILERRLATAAVEQLLAELPDAGKAQLLLRVAAVARRNSALASLPSGLCSRLFLCVPTHASQGMQAHTLRSARSSRCG
jgi:hypothetical protein